MVADGETWRADKRSLTVLLRPKTRLIETKIETLESNAQQLRDELNSQAEDLKLLRETMEADGEAWKTDKDSLTVLGLVATQLHSKFNTLKSNAAEEQDRHQQEMQQLRNEFNLQTEDFRLLREEMEADGNTWQADKDSLTVLRLVATQLQTKINTLKSNAAEEQDRQQQEAQQLRNEIHTQTEDFRILKEKTKADGNTWQADKDSLTVLRLVATQLQTKINALKSNAAEEQLTAQQLRNEINTQTEGFRVLKEKVKANDDLWQADKNSLNVLQRKVLLSLGSCSRSTAIQQGDCRFEA